MKWLVHFFNFLIFSGLLVLSSCNSFESQVSVIPGATSTAPVITGVQAPANATYANGSSLSITLNFSQAVTVSGTPRLPIELNNGTVYATYQSGSGTSALIFSYTIQPTDSDNDGITLQALDLSSGNVINSNALAPSLDYTQPNTSLILVDGSLIGITSLTLPATQNYSTGNHLDFKVNFSDVVQVTGTPRLALDVGGATVYANYLSGDNSTQLTFRYTVLTGQADSNGIALISPLQLNGGSISQTSSLNFTSPNSSSVTINFGSPSILSVTPPADGAYLLGETLDFTVAFDQPVVVSLIPRLQLNIDSGPVYATYQSGGGTSTLIFRYTVADGDYETTGPEAVSPLELNSAFMRDLPLVHNAGLSYTLPDLNGIVIKGISTSIASLTFPADGIYGIGSELNFTAQHTYGVTVSGNPVLIWNNGANSVSIPFDSSSLDHKDLTFKYTITENSTEDSDGLLILPRIFTAANASSYDDVTFGILDLSSTGGSAIEDMFGTATPLSLPGTLENSIRIDSVRPTAVASTISGAGTYGANSPIVFSLDMNETVEVTGTPTITFRLGASTKTASYFSGTSTGTLNFRYVVTASDSDTDGLDQISDINLPGGATIEDTAGNDILNRSFPSLDASGIFVDGTAPAISSILLPPSGTYTSGNELIFTLQFSEPVNITGTPRILIDMGGNPGHAVYNAALSTNGSSTHHFTYTVTGSDFDADGIVPKTLVELNGGTIANSSNVNAALTLPSHNASGILINGANPTLMSFVYPSGSSKVGDEIQIAAEFSFNVYVTGTPKLRLSIGGATKYVDYHSGSGSRALLFSYTVEPGDLDTDGVVNTGPHIGLTGASIKDHFGDDAIVTFNSENAAFNIDGVAPSINQVIAPLMGTYTTGQELTFQVQFNENVNVSGAPKISLQMDSGMSTLDYVSGSGSNTLLFKHTIQSSDSDVNSIAIGSAMTLSGASIRDVAGNSLTNLTFTAPSTSGILINATSPTITSVSGPANGTYYTGNNIDFNVTYSTAVDVTGNPRIALNVGAALRYAVYESSPSANVLRFRYTVLPGDSDANGIALSSPLDLNGGTIQSPTLHSSIATGELSFSAPVTTGILVDGIDLAITSVTAPNAGTYKIGDYIYVSFVFDDVARVTGSPQVTLKIGSTNRQATYHSGDNTTTITFRYQVAGGDEDTNGLELTSTSIDLNGGTIKDNNNYNAALTFSSATYASVLVDGVRPTISSMSAPSNGTYLKDQNLDLVLTFNETVSVANAIPRLHLTVGAASVYATYQSGTGSNQLTFRYTVEEARLDTDGIAAAGVLDTNGATISDTVGNTQTNLNFTVPPLTGVLVNGVTPSIISVTSSAGTYDELDQLDLSVTFSENVNVITTGGTPHLPIIIGSTTKNASYISGSGTSTLLFRYVVESNLSDNDGITVDFPVVLNSGTIKSSAGNNAAVTFTDTNIATVLVDSAPPGIASVTLPTHGAYQNGHATRSQMNFQITWGENVTVNTAGGIPRLQIELARNSSVSPTTKYATYVSGSGTNTLTFRYSPAAGDLDLDGIKIGGSSLVDLNGGTIKNGATTNVGLDFSSYVSASSTANLFVALASMSSWYDVNDSAKITLGQSSGIFYVTGLTDKIGTQNLTWSSFGGAYFGALYSNTGFNGTTQAYMTCAPTLQTIGWQYSGFQPGSIITPPKAGIFAIKSPSSGTNTLSVPKTYQFIFGESSMGSPLMEFVSSNSKFKLGNSPPIGQFFQKLGSDPDLIWQPSALNSANNTWSANGYALYGVNWDWGMNSVTNFNYYFCSFLGQMAQAIFFSAQPSATEMIAIQGYLYDRYGLLFPGGTAP